MWMMSDGEVREGENTGNYSRPTACVIGTSHVLGAAPSAE